MLECAQRVAAESDAREADDVERRQEARRRTQTYLPTMPNALREHAHEHEDLFTYRIPGLPGLS